MNNNLKPFIKWVGGKRQLLPEIAKNLPQQYATYYEPFIGAGAVFLHLQPKKAVINDANQDLMNVYNVIKQDVEKLITELEKHQASNSKDYYYATRNIDRADSFSDLDHVQRAARFIYMNKVGYNGLYRVNKQGHFNVPYGRYKNPKINDQSLLRDVSVYLNQNQVEILSMDFEAAVKNVGKQDLVYFDPPYDPLSTTSSFTGYQKEGFDRNEQIRLKLCADDLVRRGAKVILSNSSTNFIIDLYSNRLEDAKSEVDYYVVNLVDAKRSINSKADGRGKIKEVLVISKGGDYGDG